MIQFVHNLFCFLICVQGIVFPLSFKNEVNRSSIHAYSCHSCRKCFANEVILLDTLIVKKRSFYGCHHIKHILISDTVRRIENEAFAHCYNLISISIPNKNSISFIGERVFSLCLNLESFIFPKNGNFIMISRIQDN
mmetsp:Transcript_20460/g.28150  ORF Transcript_20460/g.28150 Transcript_20460/m.28150 type:complete len:137 (-) Transcript_20460:228-638(-)